MIMTIRPGLDFNVDVDSFDSEQYDSPARNPRLPRAETEHLPCKPSQQRCRLTTWAVKRNLREIVHVLVRYLKLWTR